jgi:hypothetical protein
MTQGDPFQMLADVIVGAKLAIALRALAELRLADLLVAGPLEIEQIASISGSKADPLRRVLRAVSQFGIFRERADGRFENTELSEYMRSDTPRSLRDALLFLNHQASLSAWLELPKTLKDGQSRFNEVNGGPLFSLFAADKELAGQFGNFMRNIYGPEALKIAVGFDFSRFKSVIDIGGGPGHIISEILLRHKGLRGALLDLPATAELAANFLRSKKLADRCEVVSGDFFKAVPTGYDAYLLKSVLHDWDDKDAVAILKRCREAMTTAARLLVIEEVFVPGTSVGNPHRFVDLDLMIHLGGRERTQTEYESLLQQAGLVASKPQRIEGSFFSVIESRSTE